MIDILSKRYNLDNFEAPFREFLQNQGVSLPTLKNYLSDLRHFMGWLAVFEANSEITIATIEQYKANLLANNLPFKTINRRLSTLRKFCSFCIQQNWMKENVAKRVANVGVLVPILMPKIAAVASFPRNDMVTEFKQYLLSDQAKHNDVDLILDDVSEFLSICHQA